MQMKLKVMVIPVCIASLCIALGLSAVSVHSQVTLEDIKHVEKEKLQKGVRTQTEIDKLDDSRMLLANQYRNALKQNSKLTKYNNQLKNTIETQEKEMESLQLQISRIDHLERDIVPLMSDMLDSLETFVLLDVPFLIEERTSRVKKLRSLFTNGNVANAEKYRRILEAYQIENDYGRSIEAYDDFLPSQNQKVTFFKVGRIAFLYQTLDRKHSYRWSSSDSRWEILEEKYNHKIFDGIRMAREQIPSNLMVLPLETPVG